MDQQSLGPSLTVNQWKIEYNWLCKSSAWQWQQLLPQGQTALDVVCGQGKDDIVALLTQVQRKKTEKMIQCFHWAIFTCLCKQRDSIEDLIGPQSLQAGMFLLCKWVLMGSKLGLGIWIMLSAYQHLHLPGARPGLRPQAASAVMAFSHAMMTAHTHMHILARAPTHTCRTSHCRWQVPRLLSQQLLLLTFTIQARLVSKISCRLQQPNFCTLS